LQSYLEFCRADACGQKDIFQGSPSSESRKTAARKKTDTDFSTMAIYTNETIPAAPDQPVHTYEIRQSMKDAALSTHPETGEPIRRVITGGLGIMTSGKGGASAAPSNGHGCGAGCGCG
jgi:predicted nucleic acid-binding Zn ribbon protein